MFCLMMTIFTSIIIKRFLFAAEAETARMTMMTRFVIFFISIVCPLSAQPCDWPDYFDLSSRAYEERKDYILSIYKYIQTSWRTDARLERDQLVVNGALETLTLVDIINKASIQISSVRRGNVRVVTDTYICKQKLDDNLIMLEKTKSKNISDFSQKFTTTFRCLQLKKHTKYVLQWTLGPESETEPNCNEPFGEMSEWPLVYWPITASFAPREREENSDWLTGYPSCPMSGGYLMRVFNDDDSVISGCQNDQPSSRFEMDCMKGEGLYLTPGHQGERCDKFAFNKKTGSKFYCLGSWTDSKYRYTVLVPARYMSISSFHCLRTSKDDPTSEPSVLFLDNICKSSPPNNNTESFIKLELRRKNVDSFCDDYSDQCSPAQVNCSDPAQSTTCFKSCTSCPDLTPKGSETELEHRGKWILQKVSEQQQIIIDTKKITIPVLGTFDINRVSSGPVVCGGNSFYSGNGNQTVYIVSKLADAQGCVPRIMSFSVEEINKGIAVIFYTPTNPLKNTEQALETNGWCRIIQSDINSFANIYNPYWPPISSPRISHADGWYIAVNPERQLKAAKCSYLGIMFDLKYDLTFDINNKKSHCKGRMKKGNDDESWELTYDDCDGGKTSGTHTFTCLTPVHQLTYSYRFSVIQSTDSASDSSGEIQPSGYYCLMFPILKNFDSIFDYPLIINPASRCDSDSLHSVTETRKKGQPLVRLDYDDAHHLYASQLLLFLGLFFSVKLANV